jgi:hypothetical protein
MNRDLMLAVLSMDVYENKAVGSLIGKAEILNVAPTNSYGFAAAAYSYGGETIISYRGTTNAIAWNGSDAWYGRGTALGIGSTQTAQAADFSVEVF